MLAHGVHLALVAAGLAGLGALLAPTVALRPRPRVSAPGDLHEQRVRGLRAALEQYAAGAPVTVLAPAPARPARAVDRSSLLLPLAVSSTLVTAGIHAAMVPPHLREGLAPALFFLGCTLAQLGWAERALRRPTPTWLLLGTAGNLAVVAVWAVSRTVGLPGREAVGPWDVTAVACEVVAATACLLAVRSGARRTAPWAEWHPAAHAWLALGLTCLVVLSLGGV